MLLKEEKKILEGINQLKNELNTEERNHDEM